jgi:hypothetical protein
MAVSIDRVYQKVLALANKEQRGYITPQEFNLFADHAQKEIFEQYFYDLNQFKRIPGNDTKYADMVDIIEDKISIFLNFDRRFPITTPNGDVSLKEDMNGNTVSDVHRINVVKVYYYSHEQLSIAEEMSRNEQTEQIMRSPLTKPSFKRPIFQKYNNYSDVSGVNRIKIYPIPLITDGCWISYIKTPVKPNWSYVVINDKPLYNSTNAVDFELHASEETELVYRILALAGVAIEKPQLVQTAVGLGAGQIQQEKQ